MDPCTHDVARRQALMAERDDRLAVRESERWLWVLGCAASFAIGILLRDLVR